MQTKLEKIREWSMWDGVFEGILITYAGTEAIFVKGWFNEGEYETARVATCYLDELSLQKVEEILTALGIYDGIEDIPTEVAVDEKLLEHMELERIRDWNMWQGNFEGILITYTGNKVIFIKGWTDREGTYQTERVNSCYLDEFTDQKLDEILTDLGAWDDLFILKDILVDENLPSHEGVNF